MFDILMNIKSARNLIEISMKKILPQVPTTSGESPSQPAKIERNSNNGKNPVYGPFFLEYTLMAEYVLLQKQHLPGVYVIPSAGSPLKWFGVIFIRTGLYQGGVFRFTLYVPDNYPDSDCPIVVFEPAIFNPLINIETGELDVKRAFPKWRRPVNHLWQVIQYARHAFYKIETDSPLNVKAAELFEKDLELYKLHVAESINLANETLYEKPQTDDPHAFHFTPWDPSIHEDVRRRLLSVQQTDEGQENEKISDQGLSWMQPGSLEVFSKPSS